MPLPARCLVGCVIALAAVLAAAGVASARGFQRCPPGAFRPLLHPFDGTPLRGAASVDGAFVIGIDTVTLGACGPAPARFRVTRRNTFVRARWDDCPGFGLVRLRATSNYPSCRAVVSLLKWRDPSRPRRAGLKFEALRID